MFNDFGICLVCVVLFLFLCSYATAHRNGDNDDQLVSHWCRILVGKCLARDTPVLMHDGSVKMVQDIAIGDKVICKLLVLFLCFFCMLWLVGVRFYISFLFFFSFLKKFFFFKKKTKNISFFHFIPFYLVDGR